MKAILSSEPHLANVGEVPDHDRSIPAWLNLIREAVEAADFGTIQIKVHGGEVVQIEATRKIRVPSSISKLSIRPTALAEAQQTQR